MPTELFQQSRNYEQFRCIGAACEDTCCVGWQVSVDRATYDKYQACSHPVLRPRFDQLIQIQPDAANDKTYARIVLEKSTCPFLSENLCSIQSELGEEYLSRTCATFPRIRHKVDNVIERSLDISCPEAAHLCLTEPGPAVFEQVKPEREERHYVPESLPNPEPYFWEIRSAILSVLQNRAFPITKRLVLVGHMCSKLDELSDSGRHATIPETLEGFAFGINAGFYDTHLRECSADAVDQLSTILELMTARIKLDFVPERYLELYREFADGLRLKPGANFHDCGERYAHAYTYQYVPFMATHEHMLEHYLVYYAYRTLFPFCPKPVGDGADIKPALGRFTREYMIMGAYFGIIRSTLIGLAARHGLRFGVDQVIRCIQSSSRALEHCTSYPSQVLQILAGKGITSDARMSALTQDPAVSRPTVSRGRAAGGSHK
ncbi:MAG TPA: flagellin lysine-N-methylase [Bryobacteraceae bacterium]|jgi:lysine-N-methylase|nr:flagellin lysine-N-methylase [Bryobacteraceae bacterium]